MQNASTVQWLQVYCHYLSQVRQELTDITDFIHPYDPCVASKMMIEGEQMTICHVI
jgi:hypothetical protein